MSFDNFKVDLLKISAEATLSKKNNPDVINATVGVFLNDEKNLYSLSSVSSTIKALDETKMKTYLVSDGGKEYKENVIKYILGSNKNIYENFHIYANWSSGASGALYLAMNHYKGKNILLPNSRWPNYDNAIRTLNKNIIEYNLIKDNKFDNSSISNILKMAKEKELMILLNDPAHNPTGYSMKKDEYIELINILNNNKHIKLNLLIDLAYIDFSSVDYRKEIIPLFNDLEEHVNLYLAFSGSKAFGVYGFRLGALINLSKNKEEALKYKDLMYKEAEAIYGPPNSVSIAFFNEIVKNPNVYDDRAIAIGILKKRSSLLLQELKKYKLDTYPYDDGFFVTAKTNDPFLTFEKLKKANCFVVPSYNGLRIALSAMKEIEIIEFVKILKENI